MPVLPDWATLANFIDVCKIPILLREKRLKIQRAVGSVVEHRLHTAGVTGSNPVPRTKKQPQGCFFIPGKNDFSQKKQRVIKRPVGKDCITENGCMFLL